MNFEDLISALSRDFQLSIDDLKVICAEHSINAHLAVLTTKYLNKIIAGDKTIESRFSQNRIAPYQRVQSGDILFLKEVSGPIRALAVVEETLFFGPMKPVELLKVIDQNYSGLALEDDFTFAKINSRFASLLFLRTVISFQPLQLQKRDRRGWIILR